MGRKHLSRQIEKVSRNEKSWEQESCGIIWIRKPDTPLNSCHFVLHGDLTVSSQTHNKLSLPLQREEKSRHRGRFSLCDPLTCMQRRGREGTLDLFSLTHSYSQVHSRDVAMVNTQSDFNNKGDVRCLSNMEKSVV